MTAPSNLTKLSDLTTKASVVMNRVFLLGAGFSRAMSEQMPLLKDLSVAVQQRLRTEGRELPAAAQYFGYDVEQLLSYLADPQPWLDEATILRHRAAFVDVSRVISDVIAERQVLAARSQLPSWSVVLADYWLRHNSTVITFNYDLLAEAAIMSAIRLKSPSSHVTSLQFYRGPFVPASQRTGATLGMDGAERPLSILKLHGSLNWWWSGIGSSSSDAIYEQGMSSWDAATAATLRDTQPEELLDKHRFIVPPTATKSGFYDNSTLRTQWALAAEHLRSVEELVVIGYSLPPSDLVVRALLLTNFAGSTVVPVDTGESSLQNFQELFEERCSDAFSGKSDAIPSFVDGTCQEASS